MRNFDSKYMLDPKATFTTYLPVSVVSGGCLIPGSQYQWQFPNLDVGKSLSPTVWFEQSLTFTPDFTASRVITPSRLAYPGGMQTISLSVTPQESEFSGEIRTITLSFLNEDEKIKPSVLSVTWPSMSEGGELTHWSQTDELVECDITNPKIGTTYTLVVTIGIDLKDGIKAVEYKPYAHIRDRIYLPTFETSYGNGTISETEAGTWTWSTKSQHTWLHWNSIQKVVDFLAYSHELKSVEPTLDFNPITLNMKSKDKFVTCYIELPRGYNANDIDVTSVSLTSFNGDAPLHAIGPARIGDYDGDGIRDLMVEFNMQALLRLLKVGEARLTVEGYLKDVTPFVNTVTVRVFYNFNFKVCVP